MREVVVEVDQAAVQVQASRLLYLSLPRNMQVKWFPK